MSIKKFIGKVISDHMQNTVVVEVERKIQHKIYKKMIKKTKNILADTNNQEIKVQDIVEIEETRPLSKNKHFKVIRKII